MSNPRPTGVTVLGALLITGGAYQLPGLAIAAGSCLGGECYHGGLLVISELVTLVVLAFANIGAGLGLFLARKWSWSTAITLLVISIATTLAEVSISFFANAGTSFGFETLVVVGIPGLMVPLVCVYYLTRRRAREYFGRGTILVAPAARPSP